MVTQWDSGENKGEQDAMKNTKGFTLIEIILAMALFAIILVAFLSIFTTGQINIFRGGKRSQNTYQIQQTAESIISTNSIGAYTSTNPSATATASSLQIVFPLVTTLDIPGNTITIQYTHANIPQQMVIYLPD